MIERKLPIFARTEAKRGRYYICDNFLRSWLSALQQPVAAVHFRPVQELVARADERLCHAEGHGLERLVQQLYAERSRKAIGDFALSQQVQGYWDGGQTEIDLVAIDEDRRVIRFGSCKRDPERLVHDLGNLESHVQRFLRGQKKYADWTIERVAVAPQLTPAQRSGIEAANCLAQDLEDLCRGL